MAKLAPFAIYFIACLWMCFLGYGSDNDTYAEIDAGKSTWSLHVLYSSRHPGYWLHELALYILNNIGGYIACNIVTFAASILILYKTYHLADQMGIKQKAPLILCIALNPAFMIASSSSIDYNISLFFLMLFFDALQKGKALPAGLLGGTSLAIRLGATFSVYGAMAGGVMVALQKRNIFKSYAFITSLTLLFFVVFYLPSWYVFGKDMSFLQGHLGPAEMWTAKMYIGRFVFKFLKFFGIPGWIGLVSLAILYFKKGTTPSNDQPFKYAVGALAGAFVLFAKYPVEVGYLIPLLPFFFLIYFRLLNDVPTKTAYALVVLLALNNFINISFAKPNTADHSTDAAFGVFIDKGLLLEDIEDRIRYMHCDSLKCWESEREQIKSKRS